MAKTIWSDIADLTITEKQIMLIIQEWAKTQRTPIPKQEIERRMLENGAKQITIWTRISGLVQKGYIRRSVETSNRSFYIQLRTI